MSLKIDIKEQKEGVYVVGLKGRLDSDTSLSFDERVKPYLEPSTRVLILDMSELDYITSIGLGSIFQVRKTIEAVGGKLIITNPQPQIKKVFEIVKALPKSLIFESIEEIDKYLDTMQKKEIEKDEQDPHH